MDLRGDNTTNQFSCSRKVLADIIFASKYKNFDRKFDEVICFLKEKTGCTEENLGCLRESVKVFKFYFKQKWENCYRQQAKFNAIEENWLKQILSFQMYPSSETASSSVGRPSLAFQYSSDQTKRKRTARLRLDSSTEELVYATQMKLRASGQKDASDIIKKVTTSPEYAKKIKESRDHTQLSPLEALSMFIEAKLSRSQYEIIRSYLKEYIPSYKKIQEEKAYCYPSGIEVSETQAQVPLQNLLDHTVNKITTVQKDVLSSVTIPENEHLVLTSKWGFDGSSGHSQYHQKYINELEADDKFVFIVCVVPLQLADSQNTIFWKNPTSSSTRYCRPLKIIFEKESNNLVHREKEIIDKQISDLVETLINIDNKQYVIKHELIFSMIDGKICNSLSDTTSALRCYLCNATSKEFNVLDKIVQLPLKRDYLQFGMSVLHAWLRSFECLLHIAYKLPIKSWRVNKNTEHLLQETKSKIQKEFREKTGLIIDKPKPGYGNTNTGNVARRFFEDGDISATITGIDRSLIHRFHIILQCLSSGFHINQNKFKIYCLETAQLFVSLYPWFYMSTTVHKILIHGHEILSGCILPLGQLSEEALEATNKDFKIFREFYSRKTSRKDNLRDIFNRMFISSDPFISSQKVHLKHKKKFHPDAIEMFEVDIHQ